MKTILGALLVMAVIGCATNKSLQAEMVRAELIKIDTVHRYTTDAVLQELKLTWRDSYNIDYITYVPGREKYVVGSTITLLRAR